LIGGGDWCVWRRTAERDGGWAGTRG